MGRKKKHEEHENHERWLVSYADFITLLFAFFTVMYAISLADKTKYKTAVENIQRSFLSAGGVFPLKGAPFMPYSKAPETGATRPPSVEESGKFSESQEDVQRISEQVRSLFQKTTGAGLSAGDVEVIRNEQGYKIRLGEFLLFKAGSDKLKRDRIPFLYEMGKRLSALELPIQVEGHSDDKRGPAGDKSNWQLSISRAFNVVQFLVEGVDFPEDRISLAGFGDTQPLVDNKTEEGRARNRRVEISIITPNRIIEELPW